MCHNIKTWIWAAAAGPETADIGTDDTFVFKILAKIAHSCTQLYTYNYTICTDGSGYVT